MQNILITSGSDLKSYETLRRSLEATERYKLYHIAAADLTQASQLTGRDYVAIVMDCHAFDRKSLKQVQAIHEMIPMTHILVLADQISIYSYRHVDLMDHIVALQKPYEEIMMLTLLNRLTSGAEFKPAVCPRFITDEPVRMVHLKSGLLIPSRMRNYSAGGAFIEYKGISLKVGDPVEINLDHRHIGSDKEDLRVQAKVVWIRDGENSLSPARGIGVQFANS